VDGGQTPTQWGNLYNGGGNAVVMDSSRGTLVDGGQTPIQWGNVYNGGGNAVVMDSSSGTLVDGGQTPTQWGNLYNGGGNAVVMDRMSSPSEHSPFAASLSCRDTIPYVFSVSKTMFRFIGYLQV
jgi:hypothetical protein